MEVSGEKSVANYLLHSLKTQVIATDSSSFVYQWEEFTFLLPKSIFLE